MGFLLELFCVLIFSFSQITRIKERFTNDVYKSIAPLYFLGFNLVPAKHRLIAEKMFSTAWSFSIWQYFSAVMVPSFLTRSKQTEMQPNTFKLNFNQVLIYTVIYSFEGSHNKIQLNKFAFFDLSHTKKKLIIWHLKITNHSF